MLHSYGSPINMGHKLVKDILGYHVVIQEKIDGSQVSFGVKDGELFVRSKNSNRDLGESGMFKKAIDTAKALDLVEGWTYRGEYLMKPKHNTKKYSRVPKKNIILFDIDKGQEDYIPYPAMQNEAERLGLEVVPLLSSGNGITLDVIKELLDAESILGETKVEGVVIKAYGYYNPASKKLLMAKYVSPKFKERHQKDWKKRNPGAVEKVVESFNQEAIWLKAIQHLRDEGELQNAVQDIGPLIHEIQRDVLDENEEFIKDTLFKHYKKDITRGVKRGFPEWYKERLAEGDDWK